MAKGRLACLFALSLLGNALCVPVDVPRLRRGYTDNELDSEEISRGDLMSTNTSVDEASVASINPAVTLPPVTNTYEDKRKEFQAADSFDDDDDDFPEMQTASTGGGGSNIISLLNLVNGLFPSSGGANFQRVLRNMLREYIRRYPQPLILPQNILRRQGIFDNEIDIDDTFDLRPPPFQRQESDENNSDSDSNASQTKESDERKKSKEKSDERDSEGSSESDENNGGESLEDDDDNGDNNASQQDVDSKPASDGNGDDSNGDNNSDYDDDEPPGGDGNGGGILGILAGSSGDNGESDLGSLLATISGIVVNLSGDGIDVNSLIASGIGLFVGLLSEGEENPGSVIAQYLLTSLDTITGGGAKNNGAFFGKFLSKLISGTSAGEAPEGASDESGEPAQGPKDSASFLVSLLMGLSGDMSKSSSAGSSKW